MQNGIAKATWSALGIVVSLLSLTEVAFSSDLSEFVKKHCAACHNAETREGSLDLASLKQDFVDPESGPRWVKVHDRISAGTMPPKDADQPSPDERDAVLKQLSESIVAAERAAAKDAPQLRRLTRGEYENTIRDLFDMPGIALSGMLPADGSAHGFDKHPEALDISHVNVAKYLEAAEHILDYAIATRPEPPVIQKRRISMVNRGGFVAHVVMNGDGVLLKNKLPDPDFPPAAEQNHLDQGAHERWGSFDNGATVGLFRHEDESFNPYFIEHVTIYPARYRVRTSMWSFGWDKGQMLPGRGTEAGRLSVVQRTGDGRGGQHPSYVLGYFDAPDTNTLEHEVVVWLNRNEIIGFNTASLAPAANYYKKQRAMEFTGPGIAVDWLDIEGPLFETWPPHSHKQLFGELPLAEFKGDEHPGVRQPLRPRVRQLGAGQNRPDPEPGVWTVQSEEQLADADRLLASFLPKLFRRPVSNDVRAEYVDIVKQRLEAGDSFEFAMRAAYRTALVSPDFLYHVDSESTTDFQSVENSEEQRRTGSPSYVLDDFGLACRLSYFLWNSLPDEQLAQHAATGDLRKPNVLHGEVERLLSDARSKRFVDDFLGQWLKLRQIAATDPDKKLYPEFSPYLQDSMVAETRAYFRELLHNDLDAAHVTKSNFVMINEKLAKHYAIDDVTGTGVRRVKLPETCPRGGFLTQASVLKVTANGTTTSPVPRGAFVMDRLLGEPPELPPSNVAAIEPDVRGATTIREQLAKHREDPQCAGCHARIDPPGFALEAFDVIGGFRDRYRSIGDGDPAPRGAIDPFIGISFKLGPNVDASGEVADGHQFADIQQFQSLIATDRARLLRNLAKQFAVYATGRTVGFADRPEIEAIVARTEQRGGGIRTLLHELIGSQLFTSGETPIEEPADSRSAQPGSGKLASAEHPDRMMMVASLPDVESPVIATPPEPPAPAPTFDDDQFDESHAVTLRVSSLFTPERVDNLRKLLADFPEVRLRTVDYETATAGFAYAAESDQFRNAKPEQIVERINNRVRQLSQGTFSVKSPSPIPHDQLERVDFPIVGLDCKACSLAVAQILEREEGVEHATASFGEKRAIAWIDPSKTNREVLTATLKQRNVTLDTE